MVLERRSLQSLKWHPTEGTPSNEHLSSSSQVDRPVNLADYHACRLSQVEPPCRYQHTPTRRVFPHIYDQGRFLS